MFGTSLGLTGISLGAAIATVYQVNRKPFQGELYQDIINVASANGLPTSPQDELCLVSSKAKFADRGMCQFLRAFPPPELSFSRPFPLWASEFLTGIPLWAADTEDDESKTTLARDVAMATGQ